MSLFSPALPGASGSEAVPERGPQVAVAPEAGGAGSRARTAAVRPAAARGSTGPARPRRPPPPPISAPHPLPPPARSPEPGAPADPAQPAPRSAAQAPAAPASAPRSLPRGPWGRPRATDPRLGSICSISCPAPTSSSGRCPAPSRPKNENTSRWERSGGLWEGGRQSFWVPREKGLGADSCVLWGWGPGPDFGVPEGAGGWLPVAGGSPGMSAGSQTPSSLNKVGAGAWAPGSQRREGTGDRGFPGLREDAWEGRHQRGRSTAS